MLREIHRTIVSALIWSKDKKIVLWRKDPKWGGVYVEYWHIPWWWVHDWETLAAAVVREVYEEIGLDISSYELTLLPYTDAWVSEKTLKETWEKVSCHMEFNRFEVHLDKNADDIPLSLWDDLVEVKRFDTEELTTIDQVPWWREFFQKMWYIT